MAVMTVYEALADPTRRRILDLLCRRPHLVGELVEDLGMSQPGVSRHLRMLREAGDRIDVLSVFGDVEVRTVIVAMRDATGFADHARFLFASRPVTTAP